VTGTRQTSIITRQVSLECSTTRFAGACVGFFVRENYTPTRNRKCRFISRPKRGSAVASRYRKRKTIRTKRTRRSAVQSTISEQPLRNRRVTITFDRCSVICFVKRPRTRIIVIIRAKTHGKTGHACYTNYLKFILELDI